MQGEDEEDLSETSFHPAEQEMKSGRRMQDLYAMLDARSRTDFKTAGEDEEDLIETPSNLQNQK